MYKTSAFLVLMKLLNLSQFYAPKPVMCFLCCTHSLHCTERGAKIIVRRQAKTALNGSFHIGAPWLQGPWGPCLTGLIANMALSSRRLILVKSYLITWCWLMIFVFCPSVRWLQRILDVSGLCRIAWDYFQLQQECMTFKAKSAKSTITHCWHWVVKTQNMLTDTNIWGLYKLSDGKDIQRQLQYQYCAVNKLRASFSRCSNAVKYILFCSFCTPMYASQLWCNFRKSCMQKLRVAYNFGCTAIYNLPWRANVSSHHVQCNIPTFEANTNSPTCFSKHKENLTTYGCVLWWSQILRIRPCSLNTTIAYYFVNEWSNIAVSVWLMARHVTTHWHFTWTWPVQGLAP